MDIIISMLPTYDHSETKLTEDEIQTIINLYVNKIKKSDEDLTTEELVYYGIYYKEIDKNTDLMLYYFTRAGEKNNSDAYYNLGEYYEEIHDEENLKINYKKCADLGDSDGYKNIGDYYQEKNNFKKMKKYYKKAIDLNNPDAMYALGLYYHDKNKNKAIVYYKKAIELGDIESMIMLGTYYSKNKHDVDKLLEYYAMAIEHDYEDKDKLLRFMNIKIKKIEHMIMYKKYLNSENKLKLYEHVKNYLIIKNLEHENIIMTGDCCVCLDINLELIKFSCNHGVCAKCYHNIDKCPLCRGDL